MNVRVEVIGVARLVVKLDGAAAALLRGGRAVVGTDVAYARYVTDGTGPHTIAAKNGKALFWPGAAHPVALVHHPGTKPNPYVEDALTGAAAEVRAVFETAVAAIVDTGAGSLRPALEAAGLVVQAAIQRGAPVKTGNLRRSFHTEVM